MKKFICSVVSAIMLFSLCTPAFAVENPAEYSQTEISEMTVSQLSEACKDNPSLTQEFEKSVDDAVFLYSHISEKTTVENLSVNDLNSLASIIDSNSLTISEADSLLNTWQTCEWVTSDTEVDYEYAEMLRSRYDEHDNGIVPYSYSGNVTTHVNPNDFTGVHYMVRSSLGYEKASGTFTLPTVNLKSATADPYVPYGFFGIYTQEGELGFDLGMGYKQATGKWFFVISGYARNSSGDYAHYWRELTTTYAPNDISKVNFVASITKGNKYDTVNLAVVDASNWSAIGKITVNTCDSGYDGYAGASQSHVSTNCSNVYINREVTLAYKSQSGRPFTGTTIKDAKWSDVYLYNSSTYSKWGTAQTQSARKIGQTSAYANTVQVVITTKWSEDTTNINFS